MRACVKERGGQSRPGRNECGCSVKERKKKAVVGRVKESGVLMVVSTKEKRGEKGLVVQDHK